MYVCIYEVRIENNNKFIENMIRIVVLNRNLIERRQPNNAVNTHSEMEKTIAFTDLLSFHMCWLNFLKLTKYFLYH